MSSKQEEQIPEFVSRRLEIFRSLQDRTPKPEPSPIKIELLPFNCTDEKTAGKVLDGVAGETLPADILKVEFPKTFCVAALVNGQPWDLSRPIVENCRLSFLNTDNEIGQGVFWHSSAHVLGSVIEIFFKTEIAIGPATENGFFYDFEPRDGIKVDPEALKAIEKKCVEVCKHKADFERKMITREEALHLFESNHYKTEILNTRVKEGELVNVYRTGTFIDLCRGPHITNASVITNWWVQDSSASCWNGNTEHRMLRIRAITFAEKDKMKAYKTFLEEAAKRDHRKLGVENELFFFHPWSPGCAFFYPRGAWMYNTLIKMMRDEYHERGFVEVITPNIFYEDLFKTSGHWAHYRDCMFHFKEDEDMVMPAGEGCECCQVREMGLKPMNCPGHCLVFRSKARSYKELPIRMAEFGVLHRNEATGALTGLTRVRKFVQDDAHIFCRYDQIFDEIRGGLDFIKTIYSRFGMEYDFELSTINMEKYMGDLKVWDQATSMLEQALKEGGYDYKICPGEAAFYGPKIDIHVKDCLNRRHQLATIQLDFQLPEKFDLTYQDAEGKLQRPVMIHRAILGSVERFFAIIVEHFAAKFPFWLNPQQVVIVAQNSSEEQQNQYCEKVQKRLHDECFTSEIDVSPVSMNKKIVNAFKIGAGCVLILGNREVENGTISVRWRGENKATTYPLEEFVQIIRAKRENFE